MEDEHMKLKITLLATLAFSLLVAPQALSAPRGLVLKAAQAECRAERAATGREAFRTTYGHRAMRNCVRSHAAEALEEVRNAAQECRAEREADPVAFRDKYGTNPNKRNAFGRCVSKKVHEEMAEEAEEAKNAAQECRAERQADPAAFAEKYGTNPNKRNAFGKCVSSKAQEADEEENGEGEEGGTTPPAPPAPPAP
jgi:peptidoglycan/xylan/chitin deacetylase (PgdA/CDA1 family)